MKINIFLGLILFSFILSLNADTGAVTKRSNEVDLALEILNAKKFDKAKLLFTSLAEKKDPRGSFIYAWMLMSEDKSKAVSYFKKSKNNGCNGAAGAIDWMDMIENTRTREDKIKYKATLLRSTALKGDINSQFLYASHLMNVKKYGDSYSWFSVITKLNVKVNGDLVNASNKIQKHLVNLLSKSKLLLAKERGVNLVTKYKNRDMSVCQQTRYFNSKGVDIMQEYLAKMKN